MVEIHPEGFPISGSQLNAHEIAGLFDDAAKFHQLGLLEVVARHP
jgi:hypothetical protein